MVAFLGPEGFVTGINYDALQLEHCTKPCPSSHQKNPTVKSEQPYAVGWRGREKSEEGTL